MPRISKLVFLAIALLPRAASQSPANPWRFVPANAKALVSIDWSNIRKSHIADMLRAKWIAGAAVPGAEFLDNCTRFLISSPARNSNDPNAEPPLLIVVEGQFDLAKVRSALAQYRVRPQAYNSYQVYRPQKKDSKDLAFVLVDPRTILIGDSRSIFASLDRAAFPTPEPGSDSLLSRVPDMDASYDAWAIVNAPDALGGDRLSALVSGADVDSAPRAFEFGLSLRSGLAADLTLTLASDASAKRMASALSQMMRMSIKDKLGEPALLDLEKKIKFVAQGSAAKLMVRLTPQELEKNAQIFAASHKAPAVAPLAQVRPVVKPAPAPEPKPEKKVIRIEGLDGGPREIPYQDTPDR